MAKLSGNFPLGLFVNGTNTLDREKLRGKIDFLLVKVNGQTDWEPKLEDHIETAYRLDIPCGLAIYIDGSAADKNWPLMDFNRWNKDVMVGKYLGMKATKRFHFVVLYYHTSRMYENGNVIDGQWLARIPIYMAEHLQTAFFELPKDVDVFKRRIVIGCSDDALKMVADPNTIWADWPFMSVVDKFNTPATWETIKADMDAVPDSVATAPTKYRPFWNFDPYPSHNLAGAGGAGLIAYLGTKENLLKWCNYIPAGTTPTPQPDPEPEPEPGGVGGEVNLTGIEARLAKIEAKLDYLEPIAAFFARIK